ncbi:solute carrier family 22 member 7-like [Haemaphysalis longicornis]
MDFEEVLMKAGGFGLFNKTVLVLALILSGIHTGLYSFGHFLILVAPSSEWCFLNDTSPPREDITKLPRGKCQGAVGLIGEIYNHNHTIFLEGLKTCPTGWQYDYDEYFPTITAENHWVCGDSWKLYTVHSAFWLGSMAGYLVCGLLADRIGRKKTAMILTGIGTSANVAGTYCTGLVGFSLLRFFAGMGAQTVNSLILVLVLECTVSGKRTLMVFLWGSMWCLMGSSLPWYCYLAQSWRSVLYAAIAADLGMLLCLVWIPESSSWLLSVGRADEAGKSLERLSSRNGKCVTREQFTELILSGGKQSYQKAPSIWESTKAMMTRPRLRRMTLLTNAAWFIMCLCYYGCTLELGRLGLNVYSTYSIASAFEMPVYIICNVSLDRVGRRWPNVVFLLIAGVSCILMGIARTVSLSWTLAMAALSIATLAGSCLVTSQVASEVFPTVVRGRAVQLQRLLGDLGGLVGTQVAALAEYEQCLPVTVMGVLSLVASVLVFFLPETVQLPLPQTLEDSESLARDRGLCFCPVRRRKSRVLEQNGECTTHADAELKNELLATATSSSANADCGAESIAGQKCAISSV